MDNISKKIGIKIAQLRKENGFTQAQLAERVGISTEFMGRLERGRHAASVEKLDRIADTLGVSLAELVDFGRKGSKQKVIDSIVMLLRKQSIQTLEKTLIVAKTLFD